MTCGFRRSGPAVGPFPKARTGLLRSACAAAGILLIIIIGCSRAGPILPVLRIEHEVAPLPVRVGASTLTFTVAGAAGQPVVGAHIGLEADMSHAGMSPVFSDAKEIAPGRYQAQLQFGMAGDWVILLHVVLPSGQKLERQIDVSDVRPN
jgi:hypothetical protein